jgi:3-methylcrotonyl-CoA carboxylase alpha subunit
MPERSMFDKILIANRGEIACRIITTAQQLGIHCIAVYSDVDKDAHHVALADEAFWLGPAPAADSYLNIPRILQVAVQSGAQAIHPGYGFLSENAAFAEACQQHSLIFIGPPLAAITAMASKSAAKNIMAAAGVPLVPGYHGDEQSDKMLTQESHKIGYPQLLKAAYGGGGKGMRIVNQADEFAAALAAARREAKAGFGNDKMLIERYLTKPRHVEIQLFSDKNNNCIYLSQRDCSIQRRHQKVLEEAPAPNLPISTQVAMGEAAVAAAQAINYQGAGTVEFLYDEDGTFYFMEMNTRLQVEHPVTEMITGLDLVAWQLRIANGDPLPLTQAQVTVRGHAIEVRIYAEDPNNDFLPASGQLAFLRQPTPSRHVRIDTGVRQGDHISPFYDPMIAKLIVWDENRNLAIQRMQRALDDYRIAGIKTNLPFLTQLVHADPFKAAALDTGFITTHAATLLPPATNSNEQILILATLALRLCQVQQQAQAAQQSNDPYSPWSQASSWRLNQAAVHSFELYDESAQLHRLQLQDIQLQDTQHRHDTALPQSDKYLSQRGQYLFYQSSINLVAADTRLNDFAALQPSQVSGQLDGDRLTAFIDGHKLSLWVALTAQQVTLFLPKTVQTFTIKQPETDTINDDEEHDGKLNAPMNGVIVSLLCKPDQEVNAGDALIVMEAMKMECNITAPFAGKVTEIFYQAGDRVKDGAQLLALTQATELTKEDKR